MTGTAAQNWVEIRRVYRLWVVCVPTNRPVIRKQLPDRVFPTEAAKFEAVANEVQRLHQQGRPVLIGTRSVEKSIALAERLRARQIPFALLNAQPENAAREAEITAQAGRLGAVTIATNMAGRGTDIILGGNPEALAWTQLKTKYSTRLDVPKEVWEQAVAAIEAVEKTREEGRRVAALGGLHVIGTERHEALRIDRQLAGRAGRQGDPGSAQFFVSLEDELLEGLGEHHQEDLRELGKRGGISDWDRFRPQFVRAQQRVERRHYISRVDLMVHEKIRWEILRDLGADPYFD
jgi:preprotein translocase subunit SecA